MIDVALLSVIRRWHLREKVSIREIARRTKLSRNTIAKYLASEETVPRYPKRHNPSKLDPYAADLSAWLRSNQHAPRKQKRTLRQMHAALLARGYTGSYNRVAAFARAWRQAEQEQARTAGRGVFIPLVFAPGEAFQFDWSEDWARIDGERVKLQIAQFKLSHSRAFVLRAYLLQTHEMLFDAHNHAFAVFGGVPRRGIYDNMKTAVDKVRAGKRRDVNTRFTALTSHFLFEPEFCNPASGWEKGQIEKNVLDARRRLWPTVPPMPSLDALNSWLEQRCREMWEELPHPEWRDRTIAQLWHHERSALMPVTAPFDGFVEQTKRVTPTCLVHVDRNRYSVPASFANRPVSVRLYADRVVVAAEGQVIAEHGRRIRRAHDGGCTVFDWRHYLSVVQRKPGALRNGAPFAELPEGFRRLQAILLKRQGGDREMVEILALVLLHDEQAVLAAVELALEAGAPSKPHILNLLHRLLGADPPPPMSEPPMLALQVEPLANASRYDGLREARHVA
ncbi:IS21 family transposase [Thermomonas sp.]|uniref:IS21 family transposase n=1 Tax=Thermomonas sp. TaxID=1971895 RepID=UPI002635FF6E|nr:IS21 family transposase [Thermomonas sp.]